MNAAALHPNGYPVITQCRRFINFTIPTLKEDQSLYKEFCEEPASVPHNRKNPTVHQYAIMRHTQCEYVDWIKRS